MQSARKYDVVVVGELNVDLIANRLSKFPVIGKEILAEDFSLTLGSSSAIFASNLSTLGSKVTFIGKVGTDPNGDRILSDLSAKGVDVSNIIKTGKPNTGITVVLNYGEDRAMVTYPGSMADLTIREIAEEVLKQSRHLHVSSVFLQHGLKKDILELFKTAKNFGLTTSFDPQWDPDERWDIDFDQLLPFVDIFLPNLSELKSLTGCKGMKEAVEKFRRAANIVVVKNGREGASLWKKGEIIHQKPFLNDQVVDSIGAGDSFNAGFVHKYLQGEPLQKCLEFGSLIGAVSTTAAGGTTAFGDINSVKRVAQASFNYRF